MTTRGSSRASQTQPLTLAKPAARARFTYRIVVATDAWPSHAANSHGDAGRSRPTPAAR